MTREDAVKGLRNVADWHYGKYEQTHEEDYLNDGDFLTAVANMLKAQVPKVMTLDLPPEEWRDKVIWLEIKGKKPIPCLFRKCGDRMMFGRYERIMSFDSIGSSKEGGFFLRNYGVNWRCWTSRPTDEQREVTSWNV